MDQGERKENPPRYPAAAELYYPWNSRYVFLQSYLMTSILQFYLRLVRHVLFLMYLHVFSVLRCLELLSIL